MSFPDPPNSRVDAPRGTAVRRVERKRGDQLDCVQDHVAEEMPIALIYNGVSFAVMMATPTDLEDFTYGFSLSEGLIDSIDQILGIEIAELLEGFQIRITTMPEAAATRLDAERERFMPGRGSCGICGTRELEDAVSSPPHMHRVAQFNPGTLEIALTQLSQQQPMNAATGAVHAAFWVDAAGNIALSREDVGRHNALDKLIGAMSRADMPTDSGMLLLTSRASYEMITKAARAGMGLVAAISAPTALAVDLARSAGMCLVGFARRGGYNIYTQPEPGHIE